MIFNRTPFYPIAMTAALMTFNGAAAVQAQAPAPAAAESRQDLVVNFDQSTLLQLSRPADLVIVGNPSIADVAIQSGNLLVITGKSFGITNIIALDAEKKVIQDQRLLVRRDDQKVLNLTRGKDRQTYNCTGGQCNPSMTVGDDPVYFNAVKESTVGKATTSDKSGDQGANNN
jgi:Flp pilus assembly secretin CpaC